MPLLVSVPDAAIFSVPAAVKFRILLLVKIGVVKLPVPPKLNVPSLVTDVFTVIRPELVTVNVLPLLIVIVDGLVNIVALRLRLWLIVVTAPVGGTTPPSQLAAVPHVEAPVVVM